MTKKKSEIKTSAGRTDYVVWDNVSVDGIGTPEIIPAEAGFEYIVLSAFLTFSEDIDEFTYESSGGEVLSGDLQHGVRGGHVLPYSEGGHFIVPKGEALVLGLPGPVHVGGHIHYGLIWRG